MNEPSSSSSTAHCEPFATADAGHAASSMTRNALTVLERRYLLRDDRGDVVETPAGLFRRVARAVAVADRRHEGEAAGERMEQAYVDAMEGLLFLPNSPTLMHAGTSLGQLAACFVLPVGDSIGEIFGAVRDAGLGPRGVRGRVPSLFHMRRLHDSTTCASANPAAGLTA